MWKERIRLLECYVLNMFVYVLGEGQDSKESQTREKLNLNGLILCCREY